MIVNRCTTGLSTRHRVDQKATGRSRQCRTEILLTGVLLLLTAVGALASESHEAFFAEPTSGRKVTHYSIELPVQRDLRQRFNIPDDCREVMERVNGGATYRGSIMDRGLWKKTKNDCRYHDFLNRHPQPVLADHVSGLDFGNIRIADLPLDQRCADRDSMSPSGCDPTGTDNLGMLRYFPITTPSEKVPARANCIPCALRNGRFRGYVMITATDVKCRMDANAPGVRLIAVDFADINGDRILDAVLRFIAIGPAGRPTPLVLPLTRLEASSPLSVPEAAAVR